MKRVVRIAGVGAAVALAGFMGMMAAGRPTPQPRRVRALPPPGAWETLPDRPHRPHLGHSEIGFTGLDEFTSRHYATARSRNGIVEFGIQRSIARPVRWDTEEVKLRIEVFKGIDSCCDDSSRERLLTWESDLFPIERGDYINDIMPVMLPLDPGTYTVKATFRSWGSPIRPPGAPDGPPEPPEWAPFAGSALNLTVN